MFRSITLAGVSALALFMVSPAVRADTPLDIVGVEKSIDDVARRAQETGDYIAQAFADKAIKVIAEWKKANADLIDRGFDRLDQQSKNMFRELNATAVRLQQGEAVTFIDMQHVMATAGDVIARAPGGSPEPTLSFAWPTIAVPMGGPTITIHAIGTRIANADPKVDQGVTPLKVSRVTDNEITFDVKRDALEKKRDQTVKTKFLLQYRVSLAHWYNPLSWWTWEMHTRDIEVTMLPEIPGTLTVTARLAVDSWETKVLGPLVTGGHGKDNLDRYPWSTTPIDHEQGWILDKEAQLTAKFDDNGGDGEGGSHCAGFDPNSFTDTSLNFLVVHGHKSDWLGHKSDANQNCRMWVHLKRKHHEERDERFPNRGLDWKRDTDVPLPENAISSVIEVGLYTGETYTIRNDRQIPYGLWEVFREKGMIKLRPRPLRDF